MMNQLHTSKRSMEYIMRWDHHSLSLIDGRSLGVAKIVLLANIWDPLMYESYYFDCAHAHYHYSLQILNASKSAWDHKHLWCRDKTTVQSVQYRSKKKKHNSSNNNNNSNTKTRYVKIVHSFNCSEERKKERPVHDIICRRRRRRGSNVSI